MAPTPARAPSRPGALFDTGPGGGPAEFRDPYEVITAATPADLPGAFAAMARAQAAGRWLAGYFSYELGYALEPRLAKLAPPGQTVPLLKLGVFGPPEPDLGLGEEGHLSAPEPGWSRAEHAAATERVLDWIARGDCYQVNLTFPLCAGWRGDPRGIWRRLARVQPVAYGGLVDLGGPAILSRSPELFLATDGLGGIETRPMKGTAPRDPDPALDRAAAEALASSPKDRAENLMIVDLMRNDLSRICEIGSVRVPEIFAVQSFATVHQMTSRVTGRLLPGIGLAEILRALFPCGSVTGAPKIRAMEIIRELEPFPRGVYCGSVGWIAPDGRMQLNVAIRTLTLHPDGRAVMNVGGGLVADSTPDGEYEEALWKARFATPG
jgi:para-aminobenzoate synthetase component 1